MIFNGTTFARGPGPLISVLLPTRGRWRSLAQALDSLYSLAHDKGLVEYCVKVDEDDGETRAALAKLQAMQLPGFNLKVLVSPRGRGYEDIHLYLNQLADVSTGDWLFNFIDDARMTTPAWEQAILRCDFGSGPSGCPDGIFLLIPRVEGRPGSNEFFIVRREVYEVLGHLAPTPHADTYLCSVMILLNRALYTLATIRHEHPQDGVAAEAVPTKKRTVFELTLPPMTRKKLADAGKLLKYIEEWWAHAAINLDDGAVDETGGPVFTTYPGVAFLEAVRTRGEVEAGGGEEKGGKVMIDL